MMYRSDAYSVDTFWSNFTSHLRHVTTICALSAVRLNVIIVRMGPPMCYNDRPSITPYPFAQSPIDRKHFFSLHCVLFNLTNNVSTPRHRYYRITQRSLIYQKLYADLRCIRIIRVAHCNVALPLLSIGGMVLINISIVINVDTIISTITSGERVFMYKHWITLYKEAVSLERKKHISPDKTSKSKGPQRTTTGKVCRAHKLSATVFACPWPSVSISQWSSS